MDARLQHLTILDQQITSLQQELSEILALNANIRFFINLYIPLIRSMAIKWEQYLVGIQGLSQLTDDRTDHLLKPITIEEIIHELCFPISTISVFPFARPGIRGIQSSTQFTHIPYFSARIEESGLALNMVMEHARWCNRNDIALLLDQEKAYNRVHSSYLRAVMLKFGFPSVLINYLVGLFFGNWIRININGYFTNEINPYRRLRQVDPSSPLLFNLALEPFLQHTT
ncbi:hypothetical protein G6F43_009193 [Rhizopus delemar]|nr:hypothetical protein G6F43_009193 [Rhizopus delemar]